MNKKKPPKKPKKRKCIQLEAEYYERLSAIKRKTGIPIIEIIRRAIDGIK